MSVLKLLDSEQKVAVYNAIYEQKHHKANQVESFTDEALADTSLKCVSRDVSREVLVACFTKAGIPQDIIDQIPGQPKPVESGTAPVATAPKAPAKKATVKAKPEPVAAPAPKPAPKSKKAPKLEPAEEQETAPAAASKQKRVHVVPAKDLRILSIIQKRIKPKAKSELNSTEIAEALGTSTRFVCQSIRQVLFPAGLVTYEDDTADGGVELLYVNLTEAGRLREIPPDVDKVPLPNGTSGPKSYWFDPAKKLYQKAGFEVHRPGGDRDHDYRLIKNGMTMADYVKAGGRRNNLKFDIDHGYVEVR